jgi:predicted O-linked N-acetylglucosamine transferase (SPINDLY family)
VTADHDTAVQHALDLIVQGRTDDGLRVCAQVLTADPRNVFALHVQGFGLTHAGRHAEARGAFAAALRLSPGDMGGWCNLAGACFRIEDYAGADEAYARAIALAPDHIDAIIGRAHALMRRRRHGQAGGLLEQALALRPGDPRLGALLLIARAHVCDWRDRDALLAQTLARLESGGVVMEAFDSLSLYDDPRVHRRCGEIVSAGLEAGVRPYPARKRHTGKIRVGYLSSDLHDHATAYLMAEVFERHDRDAFEIVAFSAGPITGDAMQARMRAAFDVFHEVSGLTDAQLGEAVAAAGVEIAVDLKGFTARGRTGALAGRPAAVQVNFLGYPGTLGAGFIDYLIGDAVVTPPGCEGLYAEHIVRLPYAYQPNSARPVGPATTRAAHGLPDGAVVFCSFNNPYKITPDVFASWMRILAATPGSVLWLLAGEAGVTENLAQAATRAGVDAGRLVFARPAGHADHLARLALADIVLDTAPYGAHTTASDALWAGVPVVTCGGPSFASRVAASLVTAAGLPELNRADRDDYEAFAVILARDPAMRSELSRRLIAARETSPLFDVARFTADLERAYKAMSARWRSGLAPEGFDLDPAL